MIVDVHTHTPRFRTRPGVADSFRGAPAIRPDQPNSDFYTWDDYLAVMQPVDRAICFNMAAPPAGDGPLVEVGGLMDAATRINDETSAFVKSHPEKFIGFLSVHPRDPKMLEEVERGVSDLGLRGIKLAPNYQNFDPLSEPAFRLYRRADELHLPVLFHQGTGIAQFSDTYYAHPRHLDRVAMAFPELKIIMAHMGHPWHVDCLAVIRKHPNVYADISGQFYRPWPYFNCMRLATEWAVLPKLLFASDFPIATPRETLDAIARVNDPIRGTNIPPVPLEEFAKLVHRDSLGLLNLA